MWKWIYRAGSPQTAYQWAKQLQPIIAVLCLICLSYGLIAGLLLAPTDYQQGSVYRILYIHVPAAILSLGVYTVMTVAVIMQFVWKIKVADIIARVSAPIGASFTLMTLITGAIWGKPTWGTWWIWDARLTSELILLFIYIGIIALRSAIPDKQLAAKATGIMTLVGCVNIPIVHYSVDWWNTLHQGASLNFLGKSTIVPSMLHPLLAMMAGFMFYYAWVLIMTVRAELLLTHQGTQWTENVIIKENS